MLYIVMLFMIVPLVSTLDGMDNARYNWESGAAFGFLLLAFTSIVVWLGLKLSGQTLTSAVAKS